MLMNLFNKAQGKYAINSLSHPFVVYIFKGVAATIHTETEALL